MAQRRPIASHPAFVPLLALWFAALLGLAVAVLPATVVERVLAAASLDALVPLSTAGRMIVSGTAALVGGLFGMALAALLARRVHDPRPVYAEPELEADHPLADEPVRRPLRVREELSEGLSDAPPENAGRGDGGDLAEEAEPQGVAGPSFARTLGQREEGFMILTPQPVHPPRPAPDLDRLIEQFDTAIAAFHASDDPAPERGAGGPDPVHAFVARQTRSPAPSPLGGRMPDHQAELRAALDKLARAHREDD